MMLEQLTEVSMLEGIYGAFHHARIVSICNRTSSIPFNDLTFNPNNLQKGSHPNPKSSHT